MQFTDLPVEIIIMIVKKLDFQSQLNMYNTCKSFRDTVSAFRVITECNMSMNVMATAKTLKLNFFRDISDHLLILNMRGVTDLSKTKALHALKMLKCLISLDISYTNLNIIDLMQLHSVCPTLKDITVNFAFCQSGIVQLTEKMFQKCQSVFENFENVHFVGSLNNLMNSKLAVCILEKSKLHTLKLSVVEVDNVHTAITTEGNSECKFPHFNHLAVYLINWKTTNTYDYLSNFPVLSLIELKNYEFCIIYAYGRSDVSVCGTTIFKHFFSENFNVTIKCVTDFKISLMGNVAIMLWNKETTQFDDNFFNKLYKHVKQYFPYFFPKNSIVSVPKEYDWFNIKPISPDVTSDDDDDDDCNKKKKRKTMDNMMLNYDDLFKEKHSVQLTFIFNKLKIVEIKLQTNFEYLKKITYLNISGNVYYSSNFFQILFQCCHRLETLCVEATSLSPCILPVTRFINTSTSLKNILLIDRNMDLKNIFESFSECPTLENIYLRDLRQWEHFRYTDDNLLIEQCPNLCSVVIEAPLSESTLVKQLKVLNKAKTKLRRHHVKVIINNVSNSPFKYNYDPILDVFKLYPVKPI